jgi:hypothetical protein
MISTSKLSPPQNALIKRLRTDGPQRLDSVHTYTLEGLMRRQLATVQDGMAVAISLTDGAA